MRTRVSAFLLVLISVPLASIASAQLPSTAAEPRDAGLELVVMLSRHGVRSPIGAPGQYDKYSAAPWPAWDVPPSDLTAHGYQLMKLFGAWDRTQFASEGLFAPTGCADAAHVTIVADSDQRTRETGKALAAGMFPGCPIAVDAQPEGSNDPLFRPTQAGAVHPDKDLIAAAVLGRVGGDFDNVAKAYSPQLGVLDNVLAGCGHAPANAKRTSLFQIPDARLRVSTAATIAENLLLEYTNGMSQADTGWGCLDGATLRAVMQVNGADWDYRMRTPAVARARASQLLDHILKTVEQSATGTAVPGAIGKPGDRLVLLVGHDTNIVTVAGALGIDWIMDGRVDDTPPGGALLFELWRPRNGGKPFLRLEYIAQTLEQMRNSEPLTAANPPAIAPIFLPACSRADLSCTWDSFSAAVRAAIDPAYAALSDTHR
ncbi:MAG: histidine-type phosphatase [Terracidiphilus sp.]